MAAINLPLSKVLDHENDYRDVEVSELETAVDIIALELDDSECFVQVSNINSNFFLCKNPKVTPEEYIRAEGRTKYISEIKPGDRIVGFKVPDTFDIKNVRAAKRKICKVKSVEIIRNYKKAIKLSIETDLPWIGTAFKRTFSLIGHKEMVVMSNPGEKKLENFLNADPKRMKKPRAIDAHRTADMNGGTHFGQRVTEEWIIEK